MRTIPLTGAKAAGRVALIDDEDWELVSQYRWHVEQRRGRRVVYARCNYVYRDGQVISTSMHKLITGWPMTDHIDHDGLNNQWYNLRPTTTSQNNANQLPREGGASRFKGVSREKRFGKWRATIKVDRRQRWLGHFETEEDAARAYDVAARAAFGEYALVNFH